jgi:hypothetical protein
VREGFGRSGERGGLPKIHEASRHASIGWWPGSTQSGKAGSGAPQRRSAVPARFVVQEWHCCL